MFPKLKHLKVIYTAQLINNYNHHTITEDGVVTNTKTGNIKSHWLSKVGYYCVDIQENGKAKKHYLHRLLAEHFIPNPHNKRTVNHKDGNKTNNTLSNLEWATDSENTQHAYDNGLNYCTTRKVTEEALADILDAFLQGTNLTALVKQYPFNLSTLSQSLVDYVQKQGKVTEFEEQKRIQKNKRAATSNHKTYQVNMICKDTGNTICKFESLGDAIRYLGKSTSGPISNVLAGRQKSAYGYFWERV